MVDFADQLIRDLNLDVVETIALGPRAEVRTALPHAIASGPLAASLAAMNLHGAVWSHQALALSRLLDGENVVVGTGTASGKSLIFQLYALHLIKSDPKSKVIVFYPLKALAADQHKRWIAAASAAGLPATAIARIDGDVPTYERDQILQGANIVLMTPDVCQAWFMRAIGGPFQRQFLAETRLLVLDEAHSYESVFGSNVAFLLRRLISARRHAAKAQGQRQDLQIIAATATIAEPAEHLQALTGRPFSIVTDDQSGAPQHDRLIVHVNGADRGSAGESALTGIIEGLKRIGNKRFIAFIDSRQGTERVAVNVGSKDILPYRSGYEATDRSIIEDALRGGTLQGVISTSALELGIDIPDMQVGVNLGVPASRKSFRQRIGRIGRSAPGVFFVVAPPMAFRQFGETFHDYFEGSVEPSYLYTGNRFIQFAHARCLSEEMEVLGQERSSLPPGVDWPEGFSESLRIAKPGAGRPREFDLVAQLGADDPHLNYPLRQVGEATFDLRLKNEEFKQRLGTIASNQAIREAYPGANYLHLSKAYKVLGWSTSSFERAIRLDVAHHHVPTRPILRKSVTLALDHLGVIEGRIKRSANGLIAEVQLQVNEAVEGYTIGSSSFLYSTLRKDNPNMSRKQRDIRTTGVVIRLDEPWFAGGSGSAPKAREAVADALRQLLCRERSIAPSDIDCVHTNIAVMTDGAPRRVVDAVVVYDTVYGGLRLSEDLFSRIGEYASQLERAAELAGKAALVPEDVAEKIKAWAVDLTDSDVTASSVTLSDDGMYKVYRPGSMVGIYIQGVLMSREIVAPRLIDLGDGEKQFGYLYSNNGRKTFVRHDEIQPIGDDASLVYWCPDTNEYHELDNGDGRPSPAPKGHWYKVYRPGSVVLVPRYGELIRRTIATPTLGLDGRGQEVVQYEYPDDGGVSIILHDEIVTTGNDWSLVDWDPVANQFHEPAAKAEL